MTNFLHQAAGTISGQPWSFNAVSVSTADEATAEGEWHGGIAAMFNSASFNALLPTTVELTQTSTSTASSTFKQTTKTVTHATIAGTSTDPGLPYHVCEVVTLRTNLATKFGRGRWYLPAMATNAVDAAGYQISAAGVTAIVNAVNAAFAAWAGTLALQVLHRRGSIGGVVTPDSMSPITTGDISNAFATQRRRGDKVVPARSQLAF